MPFSHQDRHSTNKPLKPEFAHPYEVLKDHVQIVVASPKGGEAPLDPSSVEASKEDKTSVHFLEHNEALWKNTEKLEKFLGHAGDFEAIFFVGGHGRRFLHQDIETRANLISQRCLISQMTLPPIN